MGGSPAASTGLLCCRPYRLPPGCTAEYKFAVDRARPFACPEPPLNEQESRLNAFAVLAFCAEITLLPGHWGSAICPRERNCTHHAVTINYGGPHLVIQSAGLRGCGRYQRSFQGIVIGQPFAPVVSISGIESRGCAHQ